MAPPRSYQSEFRKGVIYMEVSARVGLYPLPRNREAMASHGDGLLELHEAGVGEMESMAGRDGDRKAE